MTQKKLKLIYNTIKQKRKEIKNIKEMYTNALSNHKEYPGILKKYKDIQAKKKSIENIIVAEMDSEFTQIDDLKRDIEQSEKELSTVVITSITKKEEVNFKDDQGNELEPIIKVKYKRV